MFQKAEEIQEALSRTGRRLALMDAGEYSVLVCGGSALKLIGLIERATNDVDVVAMVETAGEKLPPKMLREGLPGEISKAAHHVALDLGLPTDWLNDSAIEVQRLGLPPGILRRAHRREFGPCLTVFLIGRQDQVALKLYAALDREKGQRHFKDLVVIKPTRKEMESAVEWLLDRKTSHEFRQTLSSITQGLGFPDLRAFKNSQLQSTDSPSRRAVHVKRSIAHNIQATRKKSKSHGRKI